MLQITKTVLQRGAEGPQVAYLQTLLKILGYSTNSIDGIFGINTEHQVKSFQSDNNLMIDGIVGDVTWQVLETRIAQLRVPVGVKIPSTNITIPYWGLAVMGVMGVIGAMIIYRRKK